MSDTTLEFTNQLKAKRICRFCMTQDEPLTNIYSTENRKNLRAPLPLQVMACVSIEVFTNDEMPSTICKNCRLIMDYCYRFKQMCKKADTMLKQFPLTGVWPVKLEHPKYPDDLSGSTKETITEMILPTASNQPSKIEPSIVTVPVLKRKASQLTVIAASPPKKKISQTNMKIDFDSLELNLDDVEVEFIETEDPLISSPETEETKMQPIVLNRNNMKILNKQASSIKQIKPIIRQPILQTNENGTVEVVSEIITPDDLVDDNNPIRNAKPVPTNVFPCEFCERSFPLRQLLDIHAVNHVRDRNFMCEVCHKGFFSKYDLNKHSLTHTGERPFKCVVCEKAFSRSTLLRRHEKMHTDHPKFLCSYCERPFLCKEEWEKHTLNHEKKRPFECSLCYKTFAFKQGLERHESVHAAVHPFKCEHCEQSFPSQGKLARHLTAHAGNRPYPCRICTKSYLLSHHLTRHMRSHKEVALDSYKCHECNETFNDRDKLILHSANHAADNLKCPLCKEQFYNLNDVTEHINQHTEGEQYACEFCDLIFLTEEQLQEHSDTQHTEENLLYDNDDRKRSKQHIDILESFTIVGDVLIPNTDYTAKEEHAVIEEGNDSTDEDAQQNDSATLVKIELEEPSNSLPKKPLRSYGNANKTASNKATAIKNDVPTQKIDKVMEKSTNTKKAADIVKAKPLKVESKSPVKQSDRKLPAIEKPTALPTKQSPKTRSTTVTAVTVVEKKAPASTEKKSAPPSVEKKTSQQTLTQWVGKKLPNVDVDHEETATKKIVAKRSTKIAPQTVKKQTDSASQKKSTATGKLPTNKPTPNTNATTTTSASTDKPIKKSVARTTSGTKSVRIGDKLVEVKQVLMTKAQIENMKKQGKVKMKDGRLCILEP